jgi:hypothetical protein
MIDFYPNITMSEEEREAYLLELYPVYRPDRPNRVVPVQQADPEPQPKESPPVIEAAPEIAAPPVETAEPIAEEPKRHPVLANVYVGASSPLSRPK